MRIAEISFRHTKVVDLFPCLAVFAFQDDVRRCGIDHVPIGTTAKSQIKSIAKPNHVSERVLFAVVKNTADVGHANFWHLRLFGARDSGDIHGCEDGKHLSAFHLFVLSVSTNMHSLFVAALVGGMVSTSGVSMGSTRR